MNKFKKWLIHKLGGVMFDEQPIKIITQSSPCVTATIKLVLPDERFPLSDEEKMEIVNQDAANKIGDFIVKNQLCKIERNFDSDFNLEIMKYTIRIVKGGDTE